MQIGKHAGSSKGSGCVLARLTLSWLQPLISAGNAHQLQPDDLLHLDSELKPDRCGCGIQHAWEQECSRANTRAGPSLLRVLCSLYWRPILLTGLLKFINDALAFVGPLLIKILVDWLSQPITQPLPWNLAANSSSHSLHQGQETVQKELYVQAETTEYRHLLHQVLKFIKACCPGGSLFGFTAGLGLGATSMARALLSGKYNYIMARLQAQVRAGLQVVLYSKALSAYTHHPPQQHHVHTGSERDRGTQGKQGGAVQQSNQALSVPEVSSLVGVDVGRLLNLGPSLHELWSLPLQLCVALGLLYMQVRYAFVAGLLVSIALIPVNKWISQAILNASKDMMAAKDRRLALTQELVAGLRAVRMIGWEEVMTSKIEAARKDELHALATRKYLDAVCVYLWAATSLLFTCLTFGFAAWSHLPLTPGAAATSFALFQVLIMPLNALPWVVNGVLEAMVSLTRIKTFLLQQDHPRRARLEELCKNNDLSNGMPGRKTSNQNEQQHQRYQHVPVVCEGISTHATSSNTNGNVVSGLYAAYLATFNRAWYTWDHDTHDTAQENSQIVAEHQDERHSSRIGVKQHQDLNNSSTPHGKSVATTDNVNMRLQALACLKDLDLKMPAGRLITITGQVGSGKSSLLAALLAELHPVVGTAQVPGLDVTIPIAVAQQSPWLFSGTVRDNILMSQPLDATRYKQVLDAAALLPDLAAMPAGDMTLLGDKGNTLSGGQRVRVSLARVLYSQAPILLLDDVLASLDAKAAAHITTALLGAPPGYNTNTASANSCVPPDIEEAAANKHAVAQQAGLLAGRTVVAVTQSLRWIQSSDYVIHLHHGQVVYQGHPDGYTGHPKYETEAKSIPLPDDHEMPAGGSGDVVQHSSNSNTPNVSEDSGKNFLAGSSAARNLPCLGNEPGLSSNALIASSESSAVDVNEGCTGRLPAFDGAQLTSQQPSPGPHPNNNEDESESTDQSEKGGGYGNTSDDIDAFQPGGPSPQTDNSNSGGETESNSWDGAVADQTSPAAITQEEARQSGAVSGAVWRGYMSAVGWLWCAIVIISLIGMQVSKNGADVWVAHWVAVSQDNNSGPNTTASSHSKYISAMPGLSYLPTYHSGQTYIPARLTSPWQPFLYLNGTTNMQSTMHDSRQSAPEPIGSQLGSTVVGRAAEKWSLEDSLPNADGVNSFLRGLIVIAGLNALFTLVRAFSFAYAGMRAAESTHAAVLRVLCHAPLTYLEGLPAGRLMNRFSSDVSKVDDSLPFILNIFLAQTVGLFGLLGVTLVASPLMLMLLPFLGYLYRRISSLYRATARELRRLDATAMSLVMQGFVESQSGAPSIRAFKVQEVFMCKHVTHVTLHARAAITGSAASVWLSIRLQLLATCLITCLALASSLLHVWDASQQQQPGSPAMLTPYHSPHVNHESHGHALSTTMGLFVKAIVGGVGTGTAASLAGLCLAYTLSIVGLLEGLVASGAETEMEMVSMERCMELMAIPEQPDVLLPSAHAIYKQTTKSRQPSNSHRAIQGMMEPYRNQDASRLQTSSSLTQPLLNVDVENGRQADHTTSHVGDVGACDIVLQMKDVVLRYPGNTVPALAGCSFSITSGQWVGVVGRTGAGKSSIIAALLRIVEIESGQVLLHGTDIRRIPLKELRQCYGVVPQTPFIISGSIQDNLDPWRQHSKLQLVRALQSVRLWDVLCHAVCSTDTPQPGSSTQHQSPQNLLEGLLPSAMDAQHLSGLENQMIDRVLGLRIKGHHRTTHELTATQRGRNQMLESSSNSNNSNIDQQQIMSSSGSNEASLEQIVVEKSGAYDTPLSASNDKTSDTQQDKHISVSPGKIKHETGIDVKKTIDQPDSKQQQQHAGSHGNGVRSIGLSAGQQQLLCLARLLLLGRKVILLDEITACVDPITANIMSNVLHEWMKPSQHSMNTATTASPSSQPVKLHTCTIDAGCMEPGHQPVTVLQVAHQLDTILHHTQVMVMANGKVVERGCPQDLLRQQPASMFSEMVAATRHH